jgi:hypothetical protein
MLPRLYRTRSEASWLGWSVKLRSLRLFLSSTLTVLASAYGTHDSLLIVTTVYDSLSWSTRRAGCHHQQRTLTNTMSYPRVHARPRMPDQHHLPLPALLAVPLAHHAMNHGIQLHLAPPRRPHRHKRRCLVAPCHIETSLAAWPPA